MLSGRTIGLALAAVAFPCLGQGLLCRAQEAYDDTTDDAELLELRRLAAAEAGTEEAVPEEEDTGFKIAGLSLQALNPEISIVGDMVGQHQYYRGTEKRWDFDFRTLGIHVESYLDPYSKLKAAVPIDEDGAELGEAYFTRFGVLERVNVTLGKFRQQFGVVNRWHKHGLDQVDFPLPLRRIFGDGGLNQTGMSMEWAMPPLWGSSQRLLLQVTDGENGTLFSGNHMSTPCCLLRYSTYRDLSKDIYADVGLTGLIGWNDTWEVASGSEILERDRDLSTRVFGVDVALLWEPTDRMRYRNVEWRTEAYLLNRDLVAPDTGRPDTLTAWGAFTYLQTKLSRSWDVGIRGDFFKPAAKPYAGLVPSIGSFVAGATRSHQWQAGPYVTWHQSPFVKVRLEYNHINGSGFGKPEHVVMLQVIFAAGPHKHERY